MCALYLINDICEKIYNDIISCNLCPHQSRNINFAILYVCDVYLQK